jgi:hypothetical protein
MPQTGSTAVWAGPEGGGPAPDTSGSLPFIAMPFGSLAARSARRQLSAWFHRLPLHARPFRGQGPQHASMLHGTRMRPGSPARTLRAGRAIPCPRVKSGHVGRAGRLGVPLGRRCEKYRATPGQPTRERSLHGVCGFVSVPRSSGCSDRKAIFGLIDQSATSRMAPRARAAAAVRVSTPSFR